jgi:anti-anti-sigma regulatory factor
MGREPYSRGDGCLAVSQQHIGSRVVVTLTGHLDLDAVEDLAACADQICRSSVSDAVFDVTALAGVDEAGARTLAAACRCLRLHGVLAEVRGVRGQLRQVAERLGLALPEPPGVVSALRPPGTAPAAATAAG